MVADRIFVRNQPANVSAGFDPETGEYGPMYVPSPGAPNHPLYLAPHRFVSAPLPVAPEPNVEVPVTVSIDRDLEAPGELVVFLEYTDVANLGIPWRGRHSRWSGGLFPWTLPTYTPSCVKT